VVSKTEQSKKVYIGLGSNIEQPYIQIKQAIQSLNGLPSTSVVRDSGYYKSRPMGPEDQPDFVNAVAELRTILSATALLEHCQTIEQEQGRVKKRHWGERTIDLDILLYADIKMKTDKLEIPHSGISQRDFVYLPLLKLDPEINIPGLGMLKKIVSQDQPDSKNLDSKNFDNENIDNKSLDNKNMDKETKFDCRYVGSIE
jgi:2-amino-4-hydroxy-6-hydroxymethyldihydropteridine diphosphokinase